MGPPRKSKSVNKRYDEVSPTKEECGYKRSISRKRKLTGMLGPRWTTEELTRFYDSYRKCGKDWKKVACAVKNRSPDVVEALYSMNKAYLSLPHGTASAAGLIAMMTDHYSNMVGSDSDRDSTGGVGSSRKSRNRARGRISTTASKVSLDEQYESHSPIKESSIGCMSLLKGKGSGTRPRPVGKRTPRFPVSFSHQHTNAGIYSSPNKRLKLEDYADYEEVELALALTEASQRGGSPQVSGTPCKLSETVVSSDFNHTLRKHADVETKIFPNEMDEEVLEGSTEADTRELMRPLGDGTTRKNNRNLEGGNIETDIHNKDHVDDIKEECSQTEGGHGSHAQGSKLDIEVNDSKVFSPAQTQRKKSKKGLFREDEGPAFDALQALADLSLLMPPENEDVATLQLKKNQDHADESVPLEANPSNHSRERCRSSGMRMKGSLLSEGASRRTSKPRKRADFDDGSVLEDKQDPESPITKTSRKMKKMPVPKKKEANDDILFTRIPRVEAMDSGKTTVKSRIPPQRGSLNVTKMPENSCNADAWKESGNSGQSAVQNLGTNQDTLPTKLRCKRKMVSKKPEALKDLTLSDKKASEKSSLPEIASILKKKLSSCLSNQHLRRFCTFEWFYSAIDYPWFSKREFNEYLNHVGLGHVPRLTRTEWSFIRSSLGKPRRFSQQFLKQEKEKLNQYRDSVRKHYTELREGTREGLPTDLARPLSVGQHVIAIHPKTRDIHDGSVLTVDDSRFHVQFYRSDLGVEFVMDIDCMPLNPIENMPAMLGRWTAFADRYFEDNEQKSGGRAEEDMKVSPSNNPENTGGAARLLPFANHDTASLKETKVQAKEADAEALAELARALDKKEVIVAELRLMNDDVVESQKDGGSSLKDEETFKKQYAAVLMLLNEANEQVSSALCHLRRRNTYLETRQPASPAANLADNTGTRDPFDRSGDEARSHVDDIMDSSRTKAQMMLDAAIQAMSSLKNRNDNNEKIEEVIDYVNDRLPSDETCRQVVRDQQSVNSPKVVAQYPYDLIMKCIATMVMIQKCTERQFPPSDVAQILDYAVTSLRPRSSQNLPIYTDIQKCFGIIKNQILALIPT